MLSPTKDNDDRLTLTISMINGDGVLQAWLILYHILSDLCYLTWTYLCGYQPILIMRKAKLVLILQMHHMGLRIYERLVTFVAEPVLPRLIKPKPSHPFPHTLVSVTTAGLCKVPHDIRDCHPKERTSAFDPPCRTLAQG